MKRCGVVYQVSPLRATASASRIPCIMSVTNAHHASQYSGNLLFTSLRVVVALRVGTLTGPLERISCLRIRVNFWPYGWQSRWRPRAWPGRELGISNLDYVQLKSTLNLPRGSLGEINNLLSIGSICASSPCGDAGLFITSPLSQVRWDN